MKSQKDVKEKVREKYSHLARTTDVGQKVSCCGEKESSIPVANLMSGNYEGIAGYTAEADLGLGCGLPVGHAGISKGDTVIDLGSGAGNDCFIARHETGAEGRVIGVDFSQEMTERARANATKLGYNNVEFRQGDIEHLPIEDDLADVIVSNCVLNLVPNKEQVFDEIKRVLKDGGHFSISDIVLDGDLPESIQKSVEMYVGCVSGAIQKFEYLALIEKAGFTEVSIQEERLIEVPDDLLAPYLNEEEIRDFRKSDSGIISVTVYAKKPGNRVRHKDVSTEKEKTCCEPACCE